MRKFEYFFQNFTNYKLRSNFEDCACSRTKTCILHTPRVPHRVFHAKIFLPDHTQSPKKLWEKYYSYFRILCGHMSSNLNQLIMKQLESIKYIFFLLFILGHVNKYWIWTKKYLFLYISMWNHYSKIYCQNLRTHFLLEKKYYLLIIMDFNVLK